MLPQLPDNLHKILFAIGLFLLGYGGYKLQDLLEKTQQITKANLLIEESKDSINLANKILAIESNQLVTNFSSRHNQDTTFDIDDDDFLKKTLGLKWTNKNYKDSILSLYFNYAKIYGLHANLLKHYTNEISSLNQEQDNIHSIRFAMYILISIGFIFVLLGYYGILYQQNIQDEILLAQQNDLQRIQTRCQSCGKFFSSIIKFGKELDGTNSPYFCSSCYINGQFTEPDISFEEIKNKALEQTIRNKRERKKIIQSLQSLDRWKLDNYK